MSSSLRYFLKRTQKNTHQHHPKNCSRRSVLQMTGASLLLPTALTGISGKARAEEMESNRHGGPYWCTSKDLHDGLTPFLQLEPFLKFLLMLLARVGRLLSSVIHYGENSFWGGVDVYFFVFFLRNNEENWT